MIIIILFIYNKCISKNDHYYFVLVVDNCACNPCYQNSVCTNLIGDYYCNCSAGFTGKNCSVGNCS